MLSPRWSILFLAGATVFAQTPDTGTAHKASATALLNSNNTGAAHLACPATISPEPTPPAVFRLGVRA